MCSAFALHIFSGKNILNFAFVALCGALQTHFHKRGRNRKRQLPRLLLLEAAARWDPFREKAIQKNPQIFLNCNTKKIPLKMVRAQRRPFPTVFSYFFTIFIRARFSSRMRSSTVFTAARISALGMRTASVAHG